MGLKLLKSVSGLGPCLCRTVTMCVCEGGSGGLLLLNYPRGLCTDCVDGWTDGLFLSDAAEYCH